MTVNVCILFIKFSVLTFANLCSGSNYVTLLYLFPVGGCKAFFHTIFVQRMANKLSKTDYSDLLQKYQDNQDIKHLLGNYFDLIVTHFDQS